MEHGVSLSCSHERATCPYHAPDESGHTPPSYFSKIIGALRKNIKAKKYALLAQNSIQKSVM
jgi:hypothetical protein